MPYGNSVVPPTPAYPQMPTANYNATAQAPRQQSSSFSSLGFNEVAGIEGVNRWPLAPGATVPLKDSTSDLLFVKSCDMTGTPLPLRVIRMVDVTQEYMQNEGAVTRKEFNALQSAIGELKQMLEDLTAPTPRKDS